MSQTSSTINILPACIWSRHILPLLFRNINDSIAAHNAEKYIDINIVYPRAALFVRQALKLLYDFRQTCKYFSKVVNVDACMAIMHIIGLEQVTVSTNNAEFPKNVLYIGELSLLIKLLIPHTSRDEIWAIENNNLNMLNLWGNKQRNQPIQQWYIDNLAGYVIHAIKKGQTTVVKWWADFCIELDLKPNYRPSILDNATRNNQMHILDCWKESGLELPYTKSIFTWASEDGHIKLLEWWIQLYMERGRPIEYNHDAIDTAAAYGHLHVIQWWKQLCDKHDLDFKYSRNAVDSASRTGHADILNWFEKYCSDNNCEFKYSFRAMDGASENNHIHILDWWIQYAQRVIAKATRDCETIVTVRLQTVLKYMNFGIDGASKNGHMQVLKWWKQASNKYGIKLKYTSDAIVMASYNQHIYILNWWKYSGLELKYDEYAYLSALRCNHHKVASWWKESGLFVHIPHELSYAKHDK